MLILNSYAKLNLYLSILCKRPDNYHDIETVFERIDLADKITLKSLPDKKIKISCDYPCIPKDSSNLAYKSAKLLQDKLNLNKGVWIKIQKRIPIGAGLGGGSSNAASVLIGLNKLWGLRLKASELVKYAKFIGSDVPFFIYDTPFAKGTNRGDKIKPLSFLKKRKFWHILAVPEAAVSTPLAYKKWDDFYQKGKLTLPESNVKLFTSTLGKNNLSLISRYMFNGLEEVAFRLYPEISQLKQKLLEMGAEAALMSGSGSSVFALVSSKANALAIASKLKKVNRRWRFFVTRTR